MQLKDYHKNLQLYVFHGLDFDDPESDKPKADCPFCHAEQHFVVITETGQWRCLKCTKGNHYNFIQQLQAVAQSYTLSDPYIPLADRKLADDTFLAWGLLPHPVLHGEFILPAYNAKNSLANLYKVVHLPGSGPSGSGEQSSRWVVMSSPGMKAHPFGRHLLPPAFNTLDLCEGPWDAMALWEFRQRALQGKPANKLQPAILGLAGASSQSELLPYLSPTLPPDKSGLPLVKPLKNLNLLFDNDKGGQDAVYQMHKTLCKLELRPENLQVLHWPKLSVKRGYISDPDKAELTYEPVKPVSEYKEATYAAILNPDLPGGKDGKRGFDVRDLLQRKPQTGLVTLAKLLTPVPITSPKKAEGDVPSIEPLPCTSFEELQAQWFAPGRMMPTQDLRDALAVAMATSFSTPLGGDAQLWFRIIGPPGCGKSTISEAMSAAKEYVYSKSIVRGFHSGYTGGNAQADEEASLIPKIRNKTVALKDADTLITAPGFRMILAELRDIYDRVSRAAYRNKKSADHEDLPVTFVLCGTDELRAATDCDTMLGSRFLDCEITVDTETSGLLDRVQDNEIGQLVGSLNKRHKQNGDDGNELDHSPKMLLLKRYTYGFLRHLWETAHTPPEVPPIVRKRLKLMAELLSHLRARVNRHGDELRYRPRRESPTRLTQQFTRLAFCLAVVLGKSAIDDEVLRIVRKVMTNTGTGFGFEIIHLLSQQPVRPGIAGKARSTNTGTIKSRHGQSSTGTPARNLTGLSALQIVRRLNLPETTVRRILTDLQELKLVSRTAETNNSGQRGRDVHLWSLTPPVAALFDSVYTPSPSSPKKAKEK